MKTCLTANGYRDRAVWISKPNYVKFSFVGLDEEWSLQNKVGYTRRIARSHVGRRCPHKETWRSTLMKCAHVLQMRVAPESSRSYILIRSNKMQQYTGIYLLQNHSTCFGCPSHPSSGVHKTITAASGTGHSIWATTFLQRGEATLEEGCCSDTMTCTRGCSYSFMYSWWWVRWTPETCRVILQ